LGAAEAVGSRIGVFAFRTDGTPLPVASKKHALSSPNSRRAHGIRVW
jgi:hypothetical protein